MKFIKCGSTGKYLNVERIEVLEIVPATQNAPCGIVATIAGNRRYSVEIFESEAKAEEYLREYLGITDEPVLV